MQCSNYLIVICAPLMLSLFILFPLFALSCPFVHSHFLIFQLMPYPSYFNNYIIKVIALTRLYVWPLLFPPLFFLFPPGAQGGTSTRGAWFGQLYLSLLEVTWIAEVKCSLSYLWLFYVGVMSFILCTQNLFVKMDNKCIWFCSWFLMWCNQTISPLQ